MRFIPLTQGKQAMVDDEDFAALSRFRWCASQSKDGQRWYAIRWSAGKTMKMHRVVLAIEGDAPVDHINHDGLDNRRSNLRVCTKSDNCQNMKRVRSKCGLRGVTWHDEGRRWMAQIHKDKKKYYLGLYSTKEEAALAYNNAALSLYGQHARINDRERKEPA